jgi:hypothetical protein
MESDKAHAMSCDKDYSLKACVHGKPDTNSASDRNLSSIHKKLQRLIVFSRGEGPQHKRNFPASIRLWERARFGFKNAEIISEPLDI